MRFLQRSWDILSQHLPKATIPLIFFLTTPHLQAIHDTNQNGVSDLWEEKFNSGALYLNFTPTADPDADGWTNAQEAAAGTDPATGVGPSGHVRTEITHTPAVYLSPEEEGGQPELDTPEVMTINWPTVAGKKYTLLFSTDLTAGNWTAIGSPRIGAGTEIGTSIPFTQPDGSTPAALFWRVTIADEDTDSDTLTNAEEAELGSNPNFTDTDGDGLNDKREVELGTFPNSSDSDGDGVSDSEEIANGHDPQSNQSYPPRLNVAVRKASTDSLCRRGYLESNWPNYTYRDVYYNDSPYMPTASVLTWVGTMPFPDQVPEDLLSPVLNGSGNSSLFRLVRGYNAYLTQSRYWLQTKPASNVEIKRTFLKITTGCRQPTVAPVYEVLPLPIIEKLEVTIPANSTASLPIDIMPPLDIAVGDNVMIWKVISLLPVDIVGHRRGTFNAPGVISSDGTYGKETVLLENADRDENSANQRDLDTATLDKTDDDDLVKVVILFPANTKPAGVGLKLKHEGMKVDGTKKPSTQPLFARVKVGSISTMIRATS